MKKFFLLISLFYCTAIKTESINFQELHSNQLYLLCNALYFSCQRMQGELQIQEELQKIYQSCIALHSYENKAIAYKKEIPQIINILQHLIWLQEKHQQTCIHQEEIIERIVTENKTSVLVILQQMADELTRLMDTKAEEQKDNVDVLLEECKQQLAYIAGTFHVMSTSCEAIKDGKYPFEYTTNYANKIDAIQKFTEPIMQLLERSFNTLHYIQKEVMPYHNAGIDLIQQYYCNAYNCLMNNTDMYWKIIGSDAILPKPESLLF